jgi:hypothetical protein
MILDEQNSAHREQRSVEPADDAVEDLNDLSDEEVEQVYRGRCGNPRGRHGGRMPP